MTEEEEQGSIFGGLAEAAGAAWDAAGNVASAEYNAASGVVSYAEGIGDNFAAAGNELIGDSAARDDWDKKLYANAADGNASFSQAGEDLSNAATDVVGE